MSTILVVDDERVFCDLLKSLLRSHGHEVLTAYNGRDAVAAFKQHHPEFTMLDLRMPEMNGIEVLKQIRASAPQAAVMILTGWGSDEMEQQARQLGAVDFLSKAVSLDSIVAAMEQALKQPAADAFRTPPDETKRGVFGVLESDSIVLVDAKPQTRDTFSQFLSARGYYVRVAEDGPAALKTVELVRPQLIVMDVDIPGLKGPDILRSLRGKGYPGGFIMMTASEDPKLLKEALDLGSVDILGKPVDPVRLLLAIQVGLVLSRK